MTGLLAALAAALLLVALAGLLITVLAGGPLWASAGWSLGVFLGAGAMVVSIAERRRS